MGSCNADDDSDLLDLNTHLRSASAPAAQWREMGMCGPLTDDDFRILSGGGARVPKNDSDEHLSLFGQVNATDAGLGPADWPAQPHTAHGCGPDDFAWPGQLPWGDPVLFRSLTLPPTFAGHPTPPPLSRQPSASDTGAAHFLGAAQLQGQLRAAGQRRRRRETPGSVELPAALTAAGVGPAASKIGRAHV